MCKARKTLKIQVYTEKVHEQEGSPLSLMDNLSETTKFDTNLLTYHHKKNSEDLGKRTTLLEVPTLGS